MVIVVVFLSVIKRSKRCLCVLLLCVYIACFIFEIIALI